MSRSRHLRSGAAAAAALTALLVGGPLAAGAGASKKKTHTFSERCTGKLSGTNSSSGTCTGPFGKSTYKTTITPPTEKQTETYKGGKVLSKGTVAIVNGKAGGKFTITGGTGRFKGATGKGTYTVTNSKGSVITKVKGTIRY